MGKRVEPFECITARKEAVAVFSASGGRCGRRADTRFRIAGCLPVGQFARGFIDGNVVDSRKLACQLAERFVFSRLTASGDATAKVLDIPGKCGISTHPDSAYC